MQKYNYNRIRIVQTFAEINPELFDMKVHYVNGDGKVCIAGIAAVLMLSQSREYLHKIKDKRQIFDMAVWYMGIDNYSGEVLFNLTNNAIALAVLNKVLSNHELSVMDAVKEVATENNIPIIDTGRKLPPKHSSEYAMSGFVPLEN